MPSDKAEVDDRMFHFNRDIETEIGYLMSDFRHASEYRMIDTSYKNVKSECDGLVKVLFKDEYVSISFYNLIESSRDMNYIRKKKKDKIYRPSHLIFEKIDSYWQEKNKENRKKNEHIDNPSYSIENLDNLKVFVATIKLPYIVL